MKSRKRIASLLLCAALVVIMLCATISVSRYVFDEEKNLTGNYTDFIMSNNGEGQTAIMRKNADDSYTGYIAVNINNFDGDKISKRNVKFYLREPSDAEITAGKVVSAWGKELEVKPDSSKYDVAMVDGKDVQYIDSDGNPVAGYEDEANALTTLAADAKNTSAILLKITRHASEGEMPQNATEKITIVLQATQPYNDMQIFTVWAASALISMGVTSDTYQGYSERIVNIKTSTDFVWNESGILVQNQYLAKIDFTLSNNVIFDEYRFNESYDTSLAKSVTGNGYSLTLKPGADVYLHLSLIHI